MLKPQDIVLLLKLLANPLHLHWPQAQLAMHLCVSVSVINASLKRLVAVGLVQLGHAGKLYHPVIGNCEELLISGIKYIFPVKLGEITSGIKTSYAAPIMQNQIISSNDPIPVWAYAAGDQRGMSLEPLYPSVPKSISLFPDPEFYDLLCLIDAMRHGRVRERNLALKILKEKLKP
jgi:hypothetical protein